MNKVTYGVSTAKARAAMEKANMSWPQFEAACKAYGLQEIKAYLLAQGGLEWVEKCTAEVIVKLAEILGVEPASLLAENPYANECKYSTAAARVKYRYYENKLKQLFTENPAFKGSVKP